MAIVMFLGVDPGQTVGVAAIVYNPETQFVDVPILQGLQHDMALDLIRQTLAIHSDVLQVVAVEQFRLYSANAGAQTGSDLLTVRVIGRIEELVGDRVPIVKHPAAIQGPAWFYIRRVCPEIAARRINRHAKSALAQASWSLREHIYKGRKW